MSKFMHFMVVAVAVLVFSSKTLANSTPTPKDKNSAATTTSTTSATTTPTPVATPTPVVVSAQSEKIPSSVKNYSIDGKYGLGVMVAGFYELSNYESLYVDFVTSDIKAAGLGFTSFVEYGFSDRITGSLQLGFSRLLYINKFSTTSRKNFFVGDLMGNYYFMNNGKIMPYATFGAGLMASSGNVAPTANVGGGLRYQINEELSVRAELIYKTAIIHHRSEGRIGFSYHF
jgi:hypothetical protein